MKGLCIQIVTLTVALATIAGCAAPSPEQEASSLKTVTASAIPGADAVSVEISAQKKSLTKWTWTAKYQGKTYSCDADEMMRLPSCQAVG